LQKKILEFANLLRQSGLRVSVAEAIDAFQALDELSLDERDVFRDALRASLVKRGDDIATYDQLFDLYWSGFYDNLKHAFDQATGGLAEQGIDVEQLLEQIRQMLENGQMPEGEMELGDLARALLTGDLNQLEQMIRAAAAQAGAARIENMLQIGFFSRRTMEQLGAEKRPGSCASWRRGCARPEWATRRPRPSEGWRSASSRRCARACATSWSASSRRGTSTTWRSSGARPSSRRASTASRRRRSRACARW
jgi:uncharacterized protein with von Willebrand factor type A (vWA) domain